MSETYKVFKFLKVRFDESWRLIPPGTSPIFRYYSVENTAKLQVVYEAAANVFTANLLCQSVPSNEKRLVAYIHHNVLHVYARCKIEKGDKIRND